MVSQLRVYEMVIEFPNSTNGTTMFLLHDWRAGIRYLHIGTILLVMQNSMVISNNWQNTIYALKFKHHTLLQQRLMDDRFAGKPILFPPEGWARGVAVERNNETQIVLDEADYSRAEGCKYYHMTRYQVSNNNCNYNCNYVLMDPLKLHIWKV